MPTEIQWAYLAGLLDGEGDIIIAKNGAKTTIVRVRVSNTDLKMIEWIQENFGGHIAEANSNTSYGHKICLRVGWNGKKAEPILLGTLPYLLTKKARLAGLALKHIKEDNLDEREALYVTGKEINRR